MPGVRDRNLRQGDIAEQLGVLLLQGLAAVAPVPRPEDTGIDVIATLLRRDGRKLFAEDTFCIQLKSASLREIEFKGDEIKWLFALELPFFVGSVAVADGEISFFASHELHKIAADWNVQGGFSLLRIHLDSWPVGHDAANERRLCFGPPILSWKLSDLSDPVFCERAYGILKAHLLLMQTNLLGSNAGFIDQVAWKVNELPTRRGPMQSMGGSPERFFRALTKAWPILHTWYCELNSRRQWDECDRLLQLLEDMQRLGWTMPDASLIGMLKTLRDFPPFKENSGGGPMKIIAATPIRRKIVSREESTES